MKQSRLCSFPRSHTSGLLNSAFYFAAPSTLVRRTAAVACLVVTILMAPVVEHAAAQTAPPRVPVLEPIPPSLKTAAVPEPSNLLDFVVNRDAAIQLGKALFWDMQTGSDGTQACASCHFHAGADGRDTNTLAPGSNGIFDTAGPNSTLVAGDFPFHLLADPTNRFSPVLSDSDDVVGSQGVPRVDFVDVVSGSDVDAGTTVPDAVFNVGGINTRSVTGRNTPSVINAVFNFRNFWDGRAAAFFNGVNPAGPRDPNARVLQVQPDTSVVPVAVVIDNASLASQATGPPLSGVEMSWNGRSFAKLGKKLLSLPPLDKQVVSPDDSVLGLLANTQASPLTPGLATTYAAMIQAAFAPQWWNSDRVVSFAPDGSFVIAAPTAGPLTTDQFTVMEANFSLFWGLAIQMYEATLVSDDSRFDRFADGGGLGGATDQLLTAEEKLGLDVFRNLGLDPTIGAGACIACHFGAEFTSAATNNIGFIEPILPFEAPPIPELPIERMQMAAGINLDNLRYLTTPTPVQLAEGVLLLDFDPRGSLLELREGTGPGAPVMFSAVFPGTPGDCATQTLATELFPTGQGAVTSLSFASAALRVFPDCSMEFSVGVLFVEPNSYPFAVDGIEHGVLIVLPDVIYDFGFYNIGVRPTSEDLGIGGEDPPGEPLSFSRRHVLGLPIPELVGIQDPGTLPVGITEVVDGAFKVPTLRNVELTGPYFHNGGQGTLEEVVAFYNRGADFRETNLADLAPEILFRGLTPGEQAGLVAFMKTLTDERVRFEVAPFDHPQLFVANGHLGNELAVTDGGSGLALDSLIELAAVGSTGDCIGIDGSLRNCDDGNPCTDDFCIDGSGCINSPNTSPCDDGDLCTTADTCDGLGSCAGGAPLNCDDANPCTDDSCDMISGCFSINNTSPCDDGNACTSADVCGGGACIGGPPPACDDNNVCTADLCDPASGCVNIAVSGACDDGDVCTTSDTCSAGACVGGPAINCDDGNACTADSCDATLGCVNIDNTLACNDGNSCTLDSCDPTSGCVGVALGDGTVCDDGNTCTSGDVCTGGSCVATSTQQPATGDTTADCTVNILDALVIAQYTVGLRMCSEVAGFDLCDVHADGACNIVDALFVAQCTVGLVPGPDGIAGTADDCSFPAAAPLPCP